MNLVAEKNSLKAEQVCICLANQNQSADIYIDDNDYKCVSIAAESLKNDIFLVTDKQPHVVNDYSKVTGTAIIAGTIGNNELIDKLVKDGKLNVSKVEGKWESYIIDIIENPTENIDKALVIAGSDKRGTIYGIYKISEIIGVSPWVWWADSLPLKRTDLTISGDKIIGKEPSVKYRGIFFNDEEPCLGTWTRSKFGGCNHLFYAKVFELILRLKGNFLWPAMWGHAFSYDDPANPKTADDYGIVMGTSHHEPMMRAHAEWAHTKKRYGNSQWDYLTNKEGLSQFWKDSTERNKPYENLVTIGMRGDGDEPMSDGTLQDNIQLLTDIIKDQRKILSESFGKDASEIPQVWALYKEVLEYYEAGMSVPDDVTLMLCDDNFGNVRTLPEKGKERQGGYGMYYHFDYVGGPRSYKWINVIQLEKVHEQMCMAFDYGVDRIWVVNVGDLKPVELPIDYFLNLAYDYEAWSGVGKPKEFLLDWAAREFGTAYASHVAEILNAYTKANSLRKPESLEPATYSITHYDEADIILEKLAHAVESAERIYKEIDATKKDAFYQLVLYPAKASLNVVKVHVYAGKNAFYGSHGLTVANMWGEYSKAAFDEDARDEIYYNKEVAGGKWDGLMIQPHFGQTMWRSSEENVMPKLCTVTPKNGSEMAIIPQNSDKSYLSGSCTLDEFTSFNDERRYIDIANGGTDPFEYTIAANKPWVCVSSSTGLVNTFERIYISINWSLVPDGNEETAVISIKGADAEVNVNATVVILKNEILNELEEGTYIESCGYTSIEAENYTFSAPSVNGPKWELFENYGRTVSSLKVLPNRLESMRPDEDSPYLEYTIYTRTPGTLSITAYLAPTNNLATDSGLRYGIRVDNENIVIVDTLPKNFTSFHKCKEWSVGVMDNIRKITTVHGHVDTGLHKIRFYAVDAGIVLQKLVAHTGNSIKECFLGAPESYCVKK